MLPHNPKVTGSSPVPATSKDKASQKWEAFLFCNGYRIGTECFIYLEEANRIRY